MTTNKIFKISEINPILGCNQMRLVAEEGEKRLSVNIDCYTYNQLAKTLIKCSNIECFKNLITANGGNVHIEPTISINKI